LKKVEALFYFFPQKRVFDFLKMKNLSKVY